MYQINISLKAKKQLIKLTRSIQEKIAKKIDRLASNPRPSGAKKLVGSDSLYRIRQGDYRIIYAIQDQMLQILIVKVGHRRDVYRDHL